MAAKGGRNACIPVIHVKGNFYEVGHCIGEKLSGPIQQLVSESKELKNLEAKFSTDQGKNVFNSALRRVQRFYPHYLRELQGTADGAGVTFRSLFLLHLDNMIGRSEDLRKEKVPQHPPFGCSSFSLNFTDNVFIGHNEDALPEFLDHWYIVKAHIDDVEKDGGRHVEERFVALCYAGMLPGFCLGYNRHGLAYSINILCPKYLAAEGLPRHFVSRALLAATSLDDVVRVVSAAGAGIADGMSINVGFFRHPIDSTPLLHNVEVAPGFASGKDAIEAVQSQVEVLTISAGEHLIHLNAYVHMKIKEQTPAEALAVQSSKNRQKTAVEIMKAATGPDGANNAFFTTQGTNGAPSCRNLLVSLLGDESDKDYPIYREGTELDPVKTIATGIFDFNDKTLTFYTHNPLSFTPLLVMNMEDW